MGFLVGFDFIAAAMFFTWVYPPHKKKLNRCQVGKQPINHKLTGDQASHSLHQSWSGKRRFAARAPLRTARSCRNKIRRKNSTFAGGQFQNRRQGILSLKTFQHTLAQNAPALVQSQSRSGATQHCTQWKVQHQRATVHSPAWHWRKLPGSREFTQDPSLCVCTCKDNKKIGSFVFWQGRGD